MVVGAIIGMTLASVGGAAADDVMVTKAPPPSASAAAFNWTGFYVGGHLGVAWGTSNWTTCFTPSPSATIWPARDWQMRCNAS